jgi:acetolactate synthase-1/2/3 large subunit
VTRVYGLCGGHIQPMWDAVDRAGIAIVDVRHEAAAVYMAQARSELSGDLGMALVTAGPGLTNAVTAIANAQVSRSSVLILSGRPPRPQTGMGAMQDIPQADLVTPLCRRVEAITSFPAWIR